MKRFTISMSDDLKKRLDQMPGINWPEVIKEGFRKKITKLEKFEYLDKRGDLDGKHDNSP